MANPLLKIIPLVLLLFVFVSAESSPAVIAPFQKAMRSIQYQQTYCPQDYSKKAITLLKKSLRYAYPQCLFSNRKLRSAAENLLLKKEFNLVLALAKSGSADNQYKVAMAYLYGIGVKYNVKKYFYWVKKSVSQDYQPARVQYLISIVEGLDQPVGVPTEKMVSSEKTAKNQLIKLAKQGSFKAFSYMAGYFYRSHPKEAFTLSKHFAKERGRPRAYALLGVQYMDAQNQNYKLAWYWTKKAVDSGLLDTGSYAASLSSLGVLCFLMKGHDLEQGKYFLRQSALLNYTLSKKLLVCLNHHSPHECGIS